MTEHLTDSLFAATSVAIAGRALLITGPSGSGKSSLALLLIDRGAQLISDDITRLSVASDHVLAHPAPQITGKIEARGIGILTMPAADAVPVALILKLTQRSARLPDRPDTLALLGCAIPCLPFADRGTLGAIKAEMALLHHGLSA